MSTFSIFSKTMTEEEYRAFKLAEKEHAKGIAVRMNPITFKIEYYEENTGKIVSTHI